MEWSRLVAFVIGQNRRTEEWPLWPAPVRAIPFFTCTSPVNQDMSPANRVGTLEP